MKLKVGDTVLVRSGRDKGKSGKVTRVLPELNKVVVEGINVVKRSHKPSQKRPRGGIESLNHPIAVSKVGIVHPTDAKRTSRIGYVVNKDGGKTRVYRQAKNQEIKS
jgi:large subunit ribosomal protein L24